MTVVRADVFPARVSVVRPGGADAQPETYDKVRVVLTADSFLVYKDSAEGPVLAFSAGVRDYDPGNPSHRRTRRNPARPARVTTDTGLQVTWSRNASCGCGSRLRTFNPFAEVGFPSQASTRDR